jgi:hypothetical protein
MRTTNSDSLRAGCETLKARHWALWNCREARGALLNMKGTSREAMVGCAAGRCEAEVEDVNDDARQDVLASPKSWPMSGGGIHTSQKRLHFSSKKRAVIPRLNVSMLLVFVKRPASFENAVPVTTRRVWTQRLEFYRLVAHARTHRHSARALKQGAHLPAKTFTRVSTLDGRLATTADYQFVVAYIRLVL